MYQDAVLGIATHAIYAALLISMPILGVSLLTGLIISILQATTQIQEQTLAFVPKIIAVFIILIIFGPWMMNVLTDFTVGLFNDIPRLVKM
ncbi:MAG: flagellar biosynthesis protein FliQ [Methylocystaceae bacterium]